MLNQADPGFWTQQHLDGFNRFIFTLKERTNGLLIQPPRSDIHRVNLSASLRSNAPLPDSASAKELRQYDANPRVFLFIAHLVT